MDAASLPERHAVAVMPSLAACAASWEELLALGAPASDLGLVVGAGALEAAPGGAATAGRVRLGPHMIEVQALDLQDQGPRLFASCGYPYELLSEVKAAMSARRAAFDGLWPAREGKALRDAIEGSVVTIWVRSWGPELAGEAALLLLRNSTQRVRTFTLGRSWG
jgi:hypothetical protein